MTGAVVANVDQPVQRFRGAWVARMIAHIVEQFLPDRAHSWDFRARREAAALDYGLRSLGGDEIRQPERKLARALKSQG